MNEAAMQSLLDWFVDRVGVYLSGGSGFRNYAMVGAVLLIAIAIEAATKRNWRLRYGSTSFRLDVLYYGFYYSGLYHLLVLMWVYKATMVLIETHAPWLQLKLLQGQPPVVQYFVVLLAVDLIHYWSHRWRHSNRYLWPFHSVHHSQTDLTVMSNYRIHVVDETIIRLFSFVPLHIILGAGVEVWLWLDFIMMWVLLIQHSAWNWTYGPIGRILVSPAFHRLHHGTDPKFHGKNFGGTFSFWDDLFGTADRARRAPQPCGLPGNPIPEKMLAQFSYPFLQVLNELRNPLKANNPAIARAQRNDR